MILAIILVSTLAYAFTGEGATYGVNGSISQGQEASSSASYDVDVSASAVSWQKFTGATYDVCIGPYCLNLTAPVPVVPCNNNGVIDEGTPEVCDGGGTLDDCDPTSPGNDGCDWGVHIADCYDIDDDSFSKGNNKLYCSNTCKFVIWDCVPEEPAVPAPVCGDGSLQKGETCDWIGYIGGEPPEYFLNRDNMKFRPGVEFCAAIDQYTSGNLLCTPPGEVDECHLDAHLCRRGTENMSMVCGEAYDPDNVRITKSCDDDFTNPPYNNPPNKLTQLCLTDDMCVYGYEAFEPEAYLPTYMQGANCYPNGTTIENSGPPPISPLFPLGETFDITCNAYAEVAPGVNVRITPVWCPEGLVWDIGLTACVYKMAVCDWGFPNDPGGTRNDCTTVLNLTINDLECLNNFDGNNDPYPIDGPTWKQACCAFVRVGSFRMYRDTDIVVY